MAKKDDKEGLIVLSLVAIVAVVGVVGLLSITSFQSQSGVVLPSSTGDSISKAKKEFINENREQLQKCFSLAEKKLENKAWEKVKEDKEVNSCLENISKEIELSFEGSIGNRVGKVTCPNSGVEEMGPRYYKRGSECIDRCTGRSVPSQRCGSSGGSDTGGSGINVNICVETPVGKGCEDDVRTAWNFLS